jgi:hypothetical protein
MSLDTGRMTYAAERLSTTRYRSPTYPHPARTVKDTLSIAVAGLKAE